MTDDIVARLHSNAEMTELERDEEVMLDAAAEIEQLKNQISHIIEHNNPQIENANSYFKSLEEELARCNKIIDDYEEEHSKLRAALRGVVGAWDFWQSQETSNGFSELFANICEARVALKEENQS